jgi:hypothetical protein
MSFGGLWERWQEFYRSRVGDPWSDDPRITAERDRQHQLGITDAYAAQQARAQIWRRQYITDVTDVIDRRGLDIEH